MPITRIEVDLTIAKSLTHLDSAVSAQEFVLRRLILIAKEFNLNG
jgi:hypothetical protein